MNHLKLVIGFIIGASLLILSTGCSIEVIEQPVEETILGEPFTLTASYGDPETKLTFDENGLGTTWQPGDKLYLVDVAGQNNTVTLTTNITAPSKSASFTSQSSVLSGEYVVIYGQNSTSIEDYPSISDLTSLSSSIRLYGALTITDGQTSASISMKHLFAKLTLKFSNIPSGLTNMMAGMAVTKSGMPSGGGTITTTGFNNTSNSYAYLRYLFWNEGNNGSSLVCPMDLTDLNLIFFVYGTDADGRHVTYEFNKSGKNLKAGVNYNISLNFSNANAVSTIGLSSTNTSAYALANAADFRAAAYWNILGNTYSVESDIDFSNEVCIPICAANLCGHNHTLSNISMDYEKCNYVGVLSHGYTDSLNIKSSKFKGYDYVGSVSGYVSLSSKITACHAIDVTVEGENYIGGLCGYLKPSGTKNTSFVNCSIKGASTITGSSYVGGLIGKSEYSSSSNTYSCQISNCLSKATISGGDYTGGVVGYSSGSISQCGYEGNVTGGDHTGGIAGYGHSAISKSYSKGNIVGEEYVGGITGHAYYGCDNSYHIGDISSTTASKYCGGICGNSSYGTIYNCYSCGSVFRDYGISYYIKSTYSSTNLTSSSKISLSYNDADYVNCGPSKTFLSKLSVINGDEAYSTQVWKDNDAQCPLLQWQSDLLNGDITAPGFGDEDW